MSIFQKLELYFYDLALRISREVCRHMNCGHKPATFMQEETISFRNCALILNLWAQMS